MALDFRKISVLVLALVSIAFLLYGRPHHRAPAPPPPPAPVTVPVTPPVASAPAPPPPVVVVPAPKSHHAPVHTAPKKSPPPVAKKRKYHALNCSKVPFAAYTHDEDIVVTVARMRGVDENGIALLKRCIAAHKDKH